MVGNGLSFEALRYAGAAYLLFLAFKSARAALTAGAPALRHVATSTLRSAYRRGLVLHLTNPKAILFFGSLYAVGVPAGASVETLALVIAAVGLQSLLLFHGYALLFSSPPLTAGARKSTRLNSSH